ncbi:hypothetical protein OAU44_00380 [bacterium]|nr:hypothetical protein [bacterium]
MARKAIYGHATYVDPTTYPDDGTSPVGTTEWNLPPDAEGMFGNTPQTTTVSIATGDLTVTDSVTVAAAETGTTDTLDKLLITNTNEYDLIYLFAKTGQTITLTNTSSPSVAGHVKTISGADEVLSTTKPTILIRKDSYWYGYGGGTTADGSVTNVKLADMAANTVKVRDASSSGVPSDKAVADTEILIGDGTGFTAAALSGDVTMDNAGAVTIANTSVTNAMLAGSIATSKISGFDTQVQTSRLDQMATATADVALGSQKITGLADGTAAQDAATKNQVDVAQAGLDAKDSCRVGTTANITLSGEQTIDGVTTTTDRVLVKNQTAGAENGIYVSATGAWARSTDADASVEVTSGLYTLVTEGTTLAGQGFVLTTDDPITVGTTVLAFSQFSGVGDLVGGTGITKVGNTINVDASQTQITDVGALDAGSITSGFGTINNGSSAITTTGGVATGALTVTGVITGSTNAVLLAQGALRLNDSNNSNYAGFKAPADVTTSYDLILPPTSTSTTGQVLKMSATANTLEWGSAGGGTEKYVSFDNTAVTTYEGVSTTFVTSGVATRDIYIKKIDANNEGVYTKIFKNGSATEVQIA